MQSRQVNNHKQTMMVIAIDGPAGAGKSTVAKKLANIFNLSYLDTGAMYRALTFKAIIEKINLEDDIQLIALAQRTSVDLVDSKDGLKVLLDGRNVNEEIRSVEVTNNTFYIARVSGVRKIMVGWQRDIAARKGVVAEGRDIGTVVFPGATYKFYLDANIEERTQRRYKELIEKGKTIDAKNLLVELKERDHKDSTRKVGPLKKAEDAIFIDTTHLSVDQVVDKMLKYIKSQGVPSGRQSNHT